MKAGILALAINMPLIRPTRQPASTPATIPPASPKSSIACAQTTLTSANREPTDRSMPALRMANVCPMEISARIEIWRATFPRLVTLQKFGLIVPKNKAMAINTAGMPMRPQGSRRSPSMSRLERGAGANCPTVVFTKGSVTPRPRSLRRNVRGLRAARDRGYFLPSPRPV